jgi:hypothetical protein
MTTFAPSRQNALPQTELELTQSAEGSHARISPSQARVQALKASAAAYGQSTPELLASYDRATSSWRTSQHCWVEGLTVFSETWPRSGTMQSGIAYRLPALVRLTDETGSGLWPTPCADDVSDRAVPTNPHFTRNGTMKHIGANGEMSQVRLSQHVKMWPTPSAEDNRDRGHLGMPSIQRRASIGKQLMLSMVVSDTSGALNPTWVEGLMGFPIGWTDMSDED